jgi:hypothetical protein
LNDHPPAPPNVLNDWLDFLAGVAQWIQDLLNSQSNLDGLIIDAIRDATHVWSGVGVYTVVELIGRAGQSCVVLMMSWTKLTHDHAGVSPFERAGHVITNPSKMARICHEYRSYMQKSEDHIWYACLEYFSFNSQLFIGRELVRPCLVDSMLCPTKSQRLSYKSWLFVYGRSRVYMPKRLGILIDNYHVEYMALTSLLSITEYFKYSPSWIFLWHLTAHGTDKRPLTFMILLSQPISGQSLWVQTTWVIWSLEHRNFRN